MKIRDLFAENVLTVSNFLTISRVAALPFIVYYMSLESITGNRLYGYYQLVFFVIVIISDFFDGLLARSFNQVSKLGQFLDPVADKICLITLGTSLAYYKSFPIWMLGVIFIREIFVVIAAAFLFYRKDVEVEPNFLGKMSVAFMSFTAVLYLASVNFIIFGIVDVKEVCAAMTLIFYISGSILYVKTYSVYYTREDIR